MDVDLHTEGLHSLLLLEDTLDREVERLEEELAWNRRKLVYLQALGCAETALNDLDFSVRRSEGVIGTMKQLLQQTFEDRLVCADELEKCLLSRPVSTTRSDSLGLPPGTGSNHTRLRQYRHHHLHHHCSVRLNRTRRNVVDGVKGVPRLPGPDDLPKQDSASTVDISSAARKLSKSERDTHSSLTCFCPLAEAHPLETGGVTPRGRYKPELSSYATRNTSTGNVTKPVSRPRTISRRRKSPKSTPHSRPLPRGRRTISSTRKAVSPIEFPQKKCFYSLYESQLSTSEHDKMVAVDELSPNCLDLGGVSVSRCCEIPTRNDEATPNAVDLSGRAYDSSISLVGPSESVHHLAHGGDLGRGAGDTTEQSRPSSCYSDCHLEDMLFGIRLRDG